MIGAAQRSSDWTEAGLGSIASTYLLSFTIAGVLAAQFQKVFRYTVARVVASLALGGGFLISGIGSDNLQSVLIGHGLAGLGAGALYSASFNLVAASAEPESAFGWKLSAEQALGATAFFTMTSLAFGFSSMLFALSAIGFLSTLVFAAAPYAKLPASQVSAKSGWPGIAYIIGLLLIGAMMGALSGLWAFLEPITQRAGISQDLFGRIGAAGLLLGGLGGLTAGLLGARFGNAPPLVFATTCLIAALIAFSTGLTPAVAVAAFAFSFIWNLALAYQLSVASRLDVTGAFAGWMSPIIAAGATVGPILAGVLLSGVGNVQHLLIATGTIGGGALLMSAALGIRQDVSEARRHSS